MNYWSYIIYYAIMQPYIEQVVTISIYLKFWRLNIKLSSSHKIIIDILSNILSMFSSNLAGVQVEYGDEVEVHSLCIVDQNTFEVLHSHTFLQTECAVR